MGDHENRSHRGDHPPGEKRHRRGERHGGHPRAKRRLSQNFLVDGNMARKIAALSLAGPDDTVLEIGPGTGALTRHLLELARNVHAVEVDRELFDRLRVDFDDEPRLTLHCADVLQTGVADLVPEGPVVVVGNLPYHITSDLVLWVLAEHARVRRAVFLMQREVAERLTAPPGSRESGSLTLALQYRCDAEKILEVPPSCFRPMPKVHSSLVAVRFLEQPRVHPADEAFFFRTIRAAFGERRKTLANAIGHGLALPRETVERAAAGVGIDPRTRGERLTLEDFCRLADALGGSAADGKVPGGGDR